ncbi:MAG: ABC transporter transmembrane domain-containing protein [Pseudomonadota bacterium]
MEKSLFRYLWRETKHRQLLAALLTCAAFPFFYLLLNIPKEIIDNTLGADPNMEPFPRELYGFTVGQTQYLLGLCFAFLALVGVNGFIKMKVNTFKGVIAERTLANLRFELIERTLRFPRRQFQRVSQGELVSMVTAEVEPLGGYIGDAVAQPLYQGGLMLTIIVFVFVQNPLLGLAAISLIPAQAYLIPKLQVKVNALNKERVRRIRGLSEQISEAVAGVDELRAQGATVFSMTRFSARLAELFRIRLAIFKVKFLMKFLNNFIGQLTPFLFFAVGGYLVIQGDLLVGALIAGLAAYERLDAPWRELLMHYQQLQDARTRYGLLIENFDAEDVLDEKLVQDPPETAPRLNGPIKFSHLTVADGDGGRILDDVDLEIPHGATVAIVGPNAAALDRLAQLIIRAEAPTRGDVLIGDEPISTMHQSVIGRRIGYLSRDYHLFNGTVTDNLHLSMLQRPAAEAELREDGELVATADLGAGALDLAAYGFVDRNAFLDYWWFAIKELGVDDELFGRALKMKLDPIRHADLMLRIVAVRDAFDNKLAEAGFKHAIRRFDRFAYNPYMTLAENIIFGSATDERLQPFNMAREPFVQETLDHAGLTETFEQVGAQIATLLLEMFKDAEPGDPLFEQYGFVTRDILQRLKAMAPRLSKGGFDALLPQDAELVKSLPFRLNATRHRLGVIDNAIKLKVIVARQYFLENKPDRLDDAVVHFDRKTYNPTWPIMCNFVHGRVAYEIGGAAEAAEAAMRAIAEQFGIKRDITAVVGGVAAGVGGSRLPPVTRERIALLRNLLKRPDVMIFNQTLRGRDEAGRAAVRAAVRRILPDATTIWLDTALPPDAVFDRVYQLADGRLNDCAVSQLSAQVDAKAPSDLERDIRGLRQAPLFEHLPDATLRKIAFASGHIRFKPGEKIFAKGDVASAAFLLLEGTAEKAKTDSSAPFDVVGAGELVGELAALSESPRTYTLIAKTPILALQIYASALTDLIASDRVAAEGVVRALSLRLQIIAHRPEPKGVDGGKAYAAE